MSKSRRLKEPLNNEQKCAMLGTSHHDWISKTRQNMFSSSKHNNSVNNTPRILIKVGNITYIVFNTFINYNPQKTSTSLSLKHPIPPHSQFMLVTGDIRQWKIMPSFIKLRFRTRSMRTRALLASSHRNHWTHISSTSLARTTNI